MTKEAGIYIGKKRVSSVNGVEKLDSYMQTNKIRPLSYTMYKIKFKVGERVDGDM